MGCFSWVAQDTNSPIYISGWQKPGQAQRTYYMWDNKGNFWREPDYEGYGMFGSKDYHVLLAEMNNIDGKDDDEKRSKAIRIDFSSNHDGIIFPNLTESSIWKWKNKRPHHHSNQGSYDTVFDDE
jgi:hypothetical protein